MPDLETGQALLAHVLRRAGSLLPTVPAGDPQVSNADRLIDVQIGINQAYWEICGLKSWRFARTRKQFASVGEVLVTVSDVVGPTVTLSAAVSVSMAGRKLSLDSETIPHRIQAHPAATNVLTLETAYTGDMTSGTASIFQDEVATGFTDILGFPLCSQLDLAMEVEIIPETRMREMAPRNVVGVDMPGKRFLAFLDAQTIRMLPWTQSPRLFELAYNRRPPALTFDGGPTDVPILPVDYRVIIADRTLEKLYPDKRDSRGQAVSAFTGDTYNRMLSHELSLGKPRQYVQPGRSVAG